MANHCDGDSNCTGSSFKISSIKFTKLFINGDFVDSVSGRTFNTFDPRTGEVIAKVSLGDAEDVDLAVKAARHAFDNGPWPRMSGSERGLIMMKFADLIQENAEEIAALDTVNGGKLFTVCKVIDIAILCRCSRQNSRNSIEIVQRTSRTAPALAAGCTIILKPAEQTPLSALYYAHLAKRAGIPDGVLNVVNGHGHTTGAAISSHMDIDKVTFTGSTEVGRKIMMAAAASNLKPVSLELGGKSPLLIFDDADIDQAADIAFREKTKATVVGDPFDPKVHQGPQTDKKQFEKILSYIEKGDVFDEVQNNGRSNQESKQHNLWLGSGIITKNLNVANSVSRSIRAGVIWINCYVAFDVDCPYGGYKMSGFGRDYSLEALNQYLQTKSVVTPVVHSPWY
ncbi:hypothetical protein GQ457_12G030280 [Hibiscus cannabinus]